MKKLNFTMVLGFVLIAGAPIAGAPIASAQNNPELQGDYAFSFTGMTTGDGTASTPFAAVGRFTADRAGNLTNGELDTNGLGVNLGGVQKAEALAFTGTYTIGADNRGTINLNMPGGSRLAFAMLSNGNAKFVEIDASGNHGTVGSGTMEKVDTTAYNTARITGDYAFGVSGLDQSNNRTAIAGRFSANGLGVLSNGAADSNQSGTFSTLNLFAGTYIVTDTTTGRGTMNIPPVIGGSLLNLDFVFYVVNGSKVFLMESDVISPATPLLLGSVLQQKTPAIVGFTSVSLNGGMVVYFTGGTGCTGGGLITGNGIGGLTLTLDNGCVFEGAAVNDPGTYTVAPNGRTEIRYYSNYAVAYLVSTNQGFVIAPDSFGGTAATSGFGEPQALGPLSNSSVSGTYVGATMAPGSLYQTIFSGVFTADGASPTGTLTGTEDISAASGARLGVATTATYSSISSYPPSDPLAWTNGRGSISGSFGATGNFPAPPGSDFFGVIYVISPSKFIVLSDGNMSGSGPVVYPVLLIFEQ
ncbi:MAG TPA: hypothetical protein VGR55_15430 [Candidatus Acidoferrum sp.]|nr:hypothetical protein [Candidatus Acidoferrum sp.]